LRATRLVELGLALLDRDIRMPVGNVKAARPRLAALQNTVMDLIDFLDDPPLRFPMDLRSRIPNGQAAQGVIVISQTHRLGLALRIQCNSKSD